MNSEFQKQLSLFGNEMAKRNQSLAKAFRSLHFHKGHFAFAEAHFCGVPDPSIAISEDDRSGFHALWETLESELQTLLEGWFQKLGSSDSSLVVPEVLLVAEGYINAALSRQIANGNPQIGLGSLVEFGNLKSRRFSFLFGEVEVDNWGVLVHWNHIPREKCSAHFGLKWEGPFMVTSLNFIDPSYLPKKNFHSVFCNSNRSENAVEAKDPVGLGDDGKLVLLRKLQREVCFLTEYWEFKNSVLAVQFTQTRDEMLREQRQTPTEQQLSVLNNVALHRDELAVWFSWSLAEIQGALAAVAGSEKLTSDLKAEWEAVQMVTLSALQNYFYPQAFQDMTIIPAFWKLHVLGPKVGVRLLPMIWLQGSACFHLPTAN